MASGSEPAAVMRCVYINKNGNNDVIQIGERPKPKISLPGQLLIRVAYSSINPIDWKMRDGYTNIVLPYPFPHILGHDVSGRIVEVGEGVDAEKWKVGDWIFGRLRDGRIGAWAEYCVAYADDIAHIPPNITPGEAASIPLVAQTALQSFLACKLQPGERVFVSAGGGGVGSVALQIAKNCLEAGEVITTASPAKTELVKSLGADTVINYKEQQFEEVLKDIDVALDTTGDVCKTLKIMKPHSGRMRTIAGIPAGDIVDTKAKEGLNAPWYARPLLNFASSWHRLNAWGANIDYAYHGMHADGEHMHTLAKWISEGKIRAIVDSTYALDDIKSALEHQASGHCTGKVVIEVNSHLDEEM